MNINRTSLRDRCRLATVGVDKHLATEPAIPVGDGVTKKAADVKAALQSTINAADATQVARSRWIDASATEKSMRTSTLATLSALKTFVLLKFGSKDTATLADFGFSAPKQAQVMVDTKAAAVTKRAATRAARHTMGPLQKAKVTGATAATASATCRAVERCASQRLTWSRAVEGSISQRLTWSRAVEGSFSQRLTWCRAVEGSFSQRLRGPVHIVAPSLDSATLKSSPFRLLRNRLFGPGSLV